MWYRRPKKIASHKRVVVARLIREARQMVRHWEKYNPGRNPGIRIICPGGYYKARCQYIDTFTGSTCTFNAAFE